MNTRADEPVEALLCLVTWQGTFLGSAPAGLRGRNYALGYQVFDAYTGNLLIVGLLLVAFVIIAPRGIVGLVQERLHRSVR